MNITSTVSLGLSLLMITFVSIGAIAHSPNANNNCEDLLAGSVDESDVAVDLRDVELGVTYVVADLDAPSVAVYQESNGMEGLQTHGHSCRVVTYDESGAVSCRTGNGPKSLPPCETATYDADTRVL